MLENNDNKIKPQFETLLNLATNRMHSALSAYYIWKWMSISININHPKGEGFVKRNLDVMNRHIIFFAQVRSSMYKSFVADLAIFFDKDSYDDSFSLKKLIESTQDKLTADEIIEMREEINRIKQKHGVHIGFIQELRNADVAHQEIDSQSRHLQYANVENLFGAVQEILNLISNKYSRSIHWWNHIDEEVDRQMHWIMDNLERGERSRLKEIKEKWGRGITPSG